MKTFSRNLSVSVLSITAAMTTASAAPPLPGAIFTTNSSCAYTNVNIYASKADVYLNGGPDRDGAAGLLPNTSYYVKVTSPSGADLLGTSLSTATPRPASTDLNGKFTACLQLQAIVNPMPYLDSTNPGNEYKVWVSTVSTFDNDSTKTDNFKVLGSTTPAGENGSVTIRKFYDANVNGTWDAGEPELPLIGAPGWKVDLLGYDPQLTAALYLNLAVGTGTYYVSREYMPFQKNWYPTVVYADPAARVFPTGSTPPFLNQYTVQLIPTDKDRTVVYGNVCTGAGGGLTMGFWSNKNGQAVFAGIGGLAVVTSRPLVNTNGSLFIPGSYVQYAKWLLDAKAVNMAYMLSAQLSAMALNVASNNVSGGAMIFAPGVPGANPSGFASVATVMSAATTSLQSNPLTLAGSPYRASQELIKNALDRANNNLTFVQPSACTYSF